MGKQRTELVEYLIDEYLQRMYNSYELVSIEDLGADVYAVRTKDEIGGMTYDGDYKVRFYNEDGDNKASITDISGVLEVYNLGK